eukprot:g1549.t1
MAPCARWALSLLVLATVSAKCDERRSWVRELRVKIVGDKRRVHPREGTDLDLDEEFEERDDVEGMYDAHVDDMLRVADTDRDSHISMHELRVLMSKQYRRWSGRLHYGRLQDLYFDSLDADMDGELSHEELTWGGVKPELLLMGDLDGDDKITRRDVRNWLWLREAVGFMSVVDKDRDAKASRRELLDFNWDHAPDLFFASVEKNGDWLLGRPPRSSSEWDDHDELPHVGSHGMEL